VTDENLYALLTSIFCDVLDSDDIALKPELTAADVSGWDSLSHIRLMVTVERTFKIRFSAAEVVGMTNVGELAALIKAKTSVCA
jgi:acyl carrier protein